MESVKKYKSLKKRYKLIWKLLMNNSYQPNLVPATLAPSKIEDECALLSLYCRLNEIIWDDYKSRVEGGHTVDSVVILLVVKVDRWLSGGERKGWRVGGRRRGTRGLNKSLHNPLPSSLSTPYIPPSYGRSVLCWCWCVCGRVGTFLPPYTRPHSLVLPNLSLNQPRYPSSCNLETLTMERFFNGD